jgi:hypothetical protein
MGERAGSAATVGRRTTVLVALVLAGLSSCAPSPEDADDDEMTGVVVPGDDSCCWPGGGGVVSSSNFDTILLLEPDDFVRLWIEANPDHPKGPVTPDHWLAGASSFSAPLSTFTEGGDPADGPAYVDLVEGRWRADHDGQPLMVCLASRRGEAGDPVEAVSNGCGLVEQEPPVGVTLTVHFGTIGLTTN